MTEPVTPTEVTNLPSLTSLRWYAALIVFFLHVGGQTDFLWHPLGPFGIGYVGVAFFFILSGFVLAGVGGVASMRIAHVDTLGGFFNLTLTHAWWPGYRLVETWDGVSWSLSVEAFFYLCFPFVVSRLRGSRALGPFVLIALGLGLATTILLRDQFGIQGAATAYFNPLVRLPEFLLGIWLALQVQQRRRRIGVPLWAAVLAVLLSGIVSWRELLPYYPLADYVMIPSFAVLIAVAAQRDADAGDGRIERFLRHRWSQYLGTISFAFYLIHKLVIPAVMQAAGWFHHWSTLGGVVPTVVTLVLSFAAAVALHHGVEIPARQWLLHSQRTDDHAGHGLLDRLRRT